MNFKNYLHLIVCNLFLISNFIYHCYSQASFNFSGYIYNLPSIQIIPEFQKLLDTKSSGDYMLSNLTRLRFRPELILFDGDGKFVSHYELNLMLSSIPIYEIAEPGITNRQVINLYQRFINNEKFKAAQFLDLFYYKHSFDFFEFTIGRQIISWGTGRIWQPTDMFNPINPANYSKFERDGVDAISSKFFLSNLTDIELVYNFRGKYSSGNFGGRFRSNISKFDFSVMTGFFDNYYTTGFDFAGNILNAGFRGEGTYKKNKSNSVEEIRFILGLDYQFTSEIYGLIEYQHNSGGTTNKDEYFSYFDKIIKGELQNLGKNYFAVMTVYLFHPLVSASISSISNIDDYSGFISLIVKYSAFDNINFSLGGIFFYASERSEYWYYSKAVYGLFEYYY